MSKSPAPGRQEDRRSVETIRNGSAVVKIYADRSKARSGYRVCFWNGTKRMRPFFSDYARAKEEANRVARDIRHGQVSVAAADVRDLDELNAARLALAGLNIGVDQAAREFAEAHKMLGGRNVAGFVQAQLERVGNLKDATIAEVAREMVEDKQARGRGKTWIKDLRNFLWKIAGARLTKPIMAVTPEDLEKLLSSWSGRTRNNKISFLVQLFNFAKGKYLPDGEKTAAQRLTRDATLPKEVQIWTPEEAKKILDACQPVELGFFAIAMFAGVRTCEIGWMDWSQVKLNDNTDESVIDLRRAKKNLGRRVIPIQPALAAYLKAIKPPKAGRIAPCNKMENRIMELAKRTGIPWRKNACRHSFGTYRVAQLKNVGAVSLEMGNSPAIIMKHYYQAVTAAEAAKFWAIRPE